jgi:hypothetical protein
MTNGPTGPVRDLSAVILWPIYFLFPLFSPSSPPPPSFAGAILDIQMSASNDVKIPGMLMVASLLRGPLCTSSKVWKNVFFPFGAASVAFLLIFRLAAVNDI